MVLEIARMGMLAAGNSFWVSEYSDSSKSINNNSRGFLCVFQRMNITKLGSWFQKTSAALKFNDASGMPSLAYIANIQDLVMLFGKHDPHCKPTSPMCATSSCYISTHAPVECADVYLIADMCLIDDTI